MRNKILFFVPDGVGVRNYLYSDLLKYIHKEADIILWSPLKEEAFKDIRDIHDIQFEYHYKKLHLEQTKTRILRESVSFARLLHNSKIVKNETILVNWKSKPKSTKLRILKQVAQRIGKVAANNYNNILKLEKLAHKTWSKSTIESYKKDLIQAGVSAIFITHQRLAASIPLCIAAKQLGITVISVIYSWDNLPKARLEIIADKYIVWSDYMKEEIKTYYPEIDQNNVLVAGTPQFEFYFDKTKIIDRNEFAAKYGFDPKKKWICYSGDDKLTSPNDQYFLEDIAEEISNSDLKNDVQILFRRCPIDFSDRYDNAFNKYKDLIISVDPLWHNRDNGWSSGFFPKYGDVSLLVNVAHHCEFVINLGSTMAHDFAIYNKPCLYLNYDKPYNPHWTVKRVYKFQHFRTMNGLNAVGWLNSKEEIKDKIKLFLDTPDNVAPDRLKWLEVVIQHPLETSSRRIADICIQSVNS